MGHIKLHMKGARCALGVPPAVWGAHPVHNHTSPLHRCGWRQGWNYIATPKQNKTNPTTGSKSLDNKPREHWHQNCKRVLCMLQIAESETLVKQNLLCFSAGSTCQSCCCIWFDWGRREPLRTGLEMIQWDAILCRFFPVKSILMFLWSFNFSICWPLPFIP